ncbi:MAG: peptide chain release factor 3 [Alistipes sp.]|nr:peptide chain release factor 3 [Alistipes sp.]
MALIDEITKRRTFAVIAHPDAGKTTLTEKLLLFGGAIHVAGAVKSNKIKKSTTSDFMEIERQRGISVATSVMGFNYKDVKINILDTPGHEDFAEDTYRTLTAVDSVIIVIDGAKGVEAQTRKLMNVCRMRNTPVMVFINKLDRPCKDPFDLLDEVERELQIRVRPLAFPISSGDTFKGVYNIYEKNLSLFTTDERQTADAETVDFSDIASPELDDYITPKFANQLREDLELVEGVYDDFNREAYLQGTLAPVFFGSAVNNFGVRELLECFIRIAPSPRPSTTETRNIEPSEQKMTGFIFKIHANMDPNHRDRLAFMKICSGTFERNKNYLHVRSGKQLKFSSPTAFMAEKKSVIDFAYPGDIVGLHDTGTFKIGDTFTEGEKLKFTGIPSFSPELFRYIENADPMKFKQLAKGVDQLMDEGVAQLFTSSLNGRKIIGTVGQLQFEVIQYRLEHEYGAKCRWEPISIYKACWIESDNVEQLADFKRRKHSNMAVDKHGRDVFLADTSYALALAQENFKDIRFHFTSEF